jgi:hypothetical protein
LIIDRDRRVFVRFSFTHRRIVEVLTGFTSADAVP